jgi:hypothetical protein
VTIIAYRAGVLAADRRCTHNGGVAFNVRKVFRRASDGALVGGSGVAGVSDAWIRWFLEGETGPSPGLGKATDQTCCEVIVVRPDGSVEAHDENGWTAVTAEFLAIGSGWRFAIGAMEMGAGAELAVEIASRRDVHCGGGVDVLPLIPVARAAAA